MPPCPFCETESPLDAERCSSCGAPLVTGSTPESLHDLNEHLRQLVSQGKKIEAIAAYRRITQGGLADAKSYVEGLERDTEFDVSQEMPDVERKVISFLERGEKIAAIRVYREFTHASLVDAKNYVEAVERRLGLANVTRGGCFSMLLLGTTLTLGMWHWIT